MCTYLYGARCPGPAQYRTAVWIEKSESYVQHTCDVTRYTFYFYAAYEYAAAYAEMKYEIYVHFFCQRKRNHVSAFWMLDEHFQHQSKTFTPAHQRLLQNR